jgi:hypothetical protein
MHTRRRLAHAVLVMTVLGCASQALALGGDYPVGFRPRVATGTAVETEVNRLIASPGSVHGFFVNAEDRFFYAGDTAAFNAFLKQYAEIETGIVGRRLTVLPGKGVAKSPWDKGAGKPCDWRLDVCPLSWREGHSATRSAAKGAPAEAGVNPYVVEVNVWSESNVDLSAVEVPKNVEVVGKLPSPPAGYRTAVKVAPAGAPHQYVVTCSVIEVQTDGETRVAAAPRLLATAGTLGTVDVKNGDERLDSGVFCTAEVKETGGWAEVTTTVTVRVKGVEKLNSSHTVSLDLSSAAR